MAYNPRAIFESIYGKQFGLPQEYQNLLFQQGEAKLQPQFAGMQKQGLGDLNQRGFYSAVPYSNMVSNINSGYGRALTELQQGIAAQSAQAAEQQKSQLFGATSSYGSQSELARQNNQYDIGLNNLSFEHQKFLSNLSFDQQQQLMQLQKQLGKKGFMDFLGALLGQGGNIMAGWAGSGFKMGG